MRADRLSGQDLAFLAWESKRRPMHIAVRAEFRCAPGESPPSLDRLRRHLALRMQDEPRMLSRLGRRGWLRQPSWEPAPAFDIAEHVRSVPRAAVGSSHAVDRILSAPLDRRRPLWEVWLLPDDPRPGHYALLVKVHHVMIDGIAGIELLERILGGAPPRKPERPRPGTPSRGRIRLASVLRYVRDQLRRGPRTPLNGAVLARRHRALQVDAAAIQTSADRLGATRNDVVLSIVTGALQRWLRSEASRPADAPLRAFCPVSLRARGERAGFGNRIAPWFVPLPLDEETHRGRVERIHAETGRMRRRGDQHGGDGMARVVGRLGAWVAGLGMALAARRRAFGLVVTNVPGPRQPLELLGARLSELTAFVPLFPGQRVSVAVVSYDGRLFWGVSEGLPSSDQGARFAAELERELASLSNPSSATVRAHRAHRAAVA